MANTLYDEARRLFALGEIDWEADDLYCLLVNNTYTFSAAHTNLSFISGSAGGPRDYGVSGVVGVALSTKAVETNGAVNADAVRFVTCAVGRPAVIGIIIYRKKSTDETSEIIYYADVATGLPITPNGGDIIVTWSTGTNKIFRL